MEAVILEKTGSFLSTEENIGVIKLNRPEAFNAFNEQLLEDLGKALDEVEKDDDIKVVVVTADGEKAFSAGADLKGAQEMLDGPDEAKREIAEAGQALFSRLENLPKPTICAINGLCLAGGLELALACDIRVANESAKIGFVEVNVGLLPGWGGCSRAARHIGLGRAKEMILTGGQITGTEAERIGLVNKAIPFDELESTWTFMAAKIAGNAPVPIRLAKSIISKSLDQTVEEGNKQEAEGLLKCFETEDFREGIKSVFEKRKANFSGK